MAKRAQIDAVRPILTEIDKGATAVEGAIDAVVSGADKATDVLESGLEKAADVVPEVLDNSVHVAADVTKAGVRALRDPRKMIIIFGVTGLAVGAGLGVVAYKILKKRLEKQYEERLDREIDEMRNFYRRRNKSGDFATPQTTAEKLLAEEATEARDAYEGKDEPPKPVVPTSGPPESTQVRYDKVVTNPQAQQLVKDKVVRVEETTTRNIFVDGKPLVDDDWDAEAEEANRTPEVPYIISFEEFQENSFEHEQTSMTYYEGDDVLADEKDEMIPEIESFVGHDNLRFGHGSRDPNVVYIRNERTESDYEVQRSTGKFSEEVLGGFRHSDDSPRLRKARWGDDE